MFSTFPKKNFLSSAIASNLDQSKYLSFGKDIILYFFHDCPRWLSGEHVGVVTWWLWVRDPDEANFLSGVFSPLTSAEACEKRIWWLLKESCVSTGVRKSGNTCVTDHPYMTLPVKVALNPNTTNQPMIVCFRDRQVQLQRSPLL